MVAIAQDVLARAARAREPGGSWTTIAEALDVTAMIKGWLPSYLVVLCVAVAAFNSWAARGARHG